MTSLLEYQRAFLHQCFQAVPDAADLASLSGEVGRWQVYRHMVRERLWKMASAAYDRSAQVVGEARLRASHGRFMEQGRVTSPLIRQVMTDFGRFALQDPALELSTYERDLLWFECHKWELSYVTASALCEAGQVEFHFELPALLNPAFRVLSLEHPVHLRQSDGERPPQPTSLLMYRPSGLGEVRWWSTDAFGVEFFRLLQQRGITPAQAVSEAARLTGAELGRELLERLSALLALAVERGVLLGSLAPTR